MRAKLVAETLESLYPTKRTVCIEGPPGGGKTTIVEQVAKKLGVDCTVVHMPTMLVEDFGMPFDKTGSEQFVYKMPPWWPSDPGSEGILFFDDRNQASADLQKVLANICQARNLHGHMLPEKWMVVSSGNRITDKAGANRILSHLRNRETVIELDTNVDDWTDWAVRNQVAAEVVGFIRWRPALLHNFDDYISKNLTQCATPRSWVEGVSNVLGIVPKAAEYECFKGAVGEGPAAEFTAFVKIYRELPDPDDILANPKTATVPTEPATLYALSAALSSRATTKNIGALVEFLGRIPGEFAVLAMNLAIHRDIKLASTRPFIEWSNENHQIMC